VAEQSASETMADVATRGGHDPDTQDGPPFVHEAHHGRPASWSVTAVVIVGFILGGIALCIGPSWVLFWIGAAIVVLGVIIGAAVHIFDDWY
jgi:hypothetical protein